MKETVSKKFWEYLNNWADFEKNKVSKNNILTDFGEGYKQAVRDIFGKVKK